MPRDGLPDSRFRNLIPTSGGCVCSYCPIASGIGQRVLMLEGNAVDAAVATAISLAITYPQAGNLGGGGFMLIKAPGKPVECLDYRETAPRNARLEHYRFSGSNRSESPSVSGGPAVAVPGTVAGLAAALKKYGSWSWDRVIGTTIELARTGVWITNRQANYYSLYEEDLRRFPSTAEVFLPGGELPLPGDLFAQLDLAKTLQSLADQGPDAFYRGEIGERIVATVRETGGVLDLEDLAAYQPIWREPFSRQVWGREVAVPPLPSGGGIVVMTALGLLESMDVASTAARSADRWEAIGRCLRVAFAKRGQLAGDPAHMPPDVANACCEMASASFSSDSLDRLEDELGLRGAPLKVEGTMPARNTTHFGVIDKAGLAVSNTYSLNTLFGAKLIARGTGVLLNNTIDDFGVEPNTPNWYQLFEGPYNVLAPGQRPLGCMTPTLVMKGDTVELNLGGSGGPRIPSSVVQVILGVLVDGLSMSQSMQAPRVHHQFLPAHLDVEDSVPLDAAEELQRRGFEVLRYPRLGIGAGIHNDLAQKTFFAALDPRF